MKKRIYALSLIGVIYTSFPVFSLSFVNQTEYPPKKTKTTNITCLKPIDGNGATFSSKEELEKTVPMKMAAIKEAINSGKYDDVQLQKLREELWRFENAVVIKK